MSFSLVANFLKFARAITFKDSASVTWSLNKNTNEITATASGGTTSPLTTKGDLWGYDTGNNRVPISTDSYVLTADSTKTLGLKWAPGANLTPDSHPASPTIYDDEFEETSGSLDTGGTRSPSANPWVWVNQGSTTVSVAQGACQMALADSTANERLILQTVPAGTWEFQCKVAWTGSGQFAAGGLALYNSGNGKIVKMQLLGSSSTPCSWVVYQWTNVTTFSGAGAGNSPMWAPNFDMSPVYYKVVYDGTNYKFYVSPFGYTGSWFLFYSQAVATFLGAITHVGFGANSNTSASGSNMQVDWFRRTA